MRIETGDGFDGGLLLVNEAETVTKRLELEKDVNASLVVLRCSGFYVDAERETDEEE